MDAETVEKLCELNNTFYRENAASFSQTRQTPWPGWERCVSIVKDALAKADAVSAVDKNTPSELSVFDLACGNLRFERFLVSALPDTDITFYAVDNCDALVADAASVPHVRFERLDVLATLQDGRALTVATAAPACGFADAATCDLAVSFGFMHHVPTQAYRKQVLRFLIDNTRTGGYIAISFWRFLDDETLAHKAEVAHKQALEELGLPELDAGDRLLGWQGVRGAYRYCHSFTDSEIDELTATVADRATTVARFVSDGRGDNLNSYVVLRRIA